MKSTVHITQLRQGPGTIVAPFLTSSQFPSLAGKVKSSGIVRPVPPIPPVSGASVEVPVPVPDVSTPPPEPAPDPESVL